MTGFIPRRRPVVLCVLDGWGHRAEPADDNAVWRARTPHLDRLARTCPLALLDASGLAVGLADDQMGNSEVGHMNLAAGRVVMQDLPRIDQAVADGSLAANPALLRFIDRLKESGGAAHLLGLLSPGGVHSHQSQIAALALALARAGLKVFVHAFLDGRDTPPRSAEDYLRRFVAEVAAGAAAGAIAFGTVAGRYYAMDRDRRWERVERAYKTLVEAEGQAASDALSAVARSYQVGVGDEFVIPTPLAGYPGMRDGDGLVMANFRADRVRQILAALLDPAFAGFTRTRRVRFATALGMCEYSAELNCFLPALFPPRPLANMLGEVVAKAGLKQLRIAETEKYAHVTFFFNGGEEREFPGEARILVPSPKVSTYDLKPEMSAFEVTDRLVAEIEAGRFDFIVVNYANTDMVGHTGDFAAAVRAVEAVDACLGRLADALSRAGGVLLITADHGNAEMMRDPATGEPHTAHTTNRVPVMLVGGAEPGRNAPLRLRDGRLADVAPTVLELLRLPQPVEMTARSLLDREGGRAGEPADARSRSFA
ncbi:MAG: 2,3-bisphosphoglycerate-independent phosphoglycerate mutase [Pseudomonadota bacterium]